MIDRIGRVGVAPDGLVGFETEAFLWATPWGVAEDVEVVAEGIVRVTTPSHGGFYLSEDRDRQVPSELKSDRYCPLRWYEEDCEWAAVAVTFPEFFSRRELNLAHRTLYRTHHAFWVRRFAPRIREADILTALGLS